MNPIISNDTSDICKINCGYVKSIILLKNKISFCILIIIVCSCVPAFQYTSLFQSPRHNLWGVVNFLILLSKV